jgi:hypothetical protein
MWQEQGSCARQALSQARDSLSDGVAACLHAGSIGLIISIMITALLQISTSDCSSDATSGGPNPSALAASGPVPLLILTQVATY